MTGQTKRKRNIQKKKIKRRRTKRSSCTKRSSRTKRGGNDDYDDVFGNLGFFGENKPIYLPHQLEVGKFYDQVECSYTGQLNLHKINMCKGEMKTVKDLIQFLGVYVEEVLPGQTEVETYTVKLDKEEKTYYLKNDVTKEISYEIPAFTEKVAENPSSKYYVVKLKFREGKSKNTYYYCNSTTKHFFSLSKIQEKKSSYFSENNLSDKDMFIGVIYASFSKIFEFNAFL